ncbi:MAG TPA: protoporphyrinogen oxidase [Candidatus Acidoferrales bacterium]|nr:protoporphyrinogen oxidase [Candidatus Acidoferrales bacterium]
MRRLVVVGGGISGLTAAHRALEIAREKNLALELKLLEASARLGGVISTQRVDDFLIEDGPDGFLTEKPWALELCGRLGLVPRLIRTQSANRSVYVVCRGRLEPLPEGFFLMAPTRLGPLVRTPIFSWRGKARLLIEPLIRRRRHTSDESVASFVRRRLGREVLERVVQPLVGGIYGADPEELSMAATLPRFFASERAGRSVLRSIQRDRRAGAAAAGRDRSGARYSLFASFSGGMGELVDALATRLPKQALRLNARVERLERGPPGDTWTVVLRDGEKFSASGVILAAPAHAAAEILCGVAPEVSAKLKEIRYTSTATVNLAYRREEIAHPLDAFGFVVPALERRSIVACTFSSVKYPNRAPEGFVLLRAFVGGALGGAALAGDDASVEASVRRDLRALLGVTAAPLFSRVCRYPLSLPQYRVGHLDLLRAIDGELQKWPGLALAGSGYRGVGVPDCVRDGEHAAAAVLKRFGAEAGAAVSESPGGSRSAQRASE